MKKAKPVALIGAGKLADSPATQFLRRCARLGPVMAPSYRLASRIANSLQAGHPVKDYAEFDDCRMILISVPDAALSNVVADLVSTGIGWHGKAVVVCSAWLDSTELRELSSRGCSTGSIGPIPGFEDSRFLVEGDPLAIRESQALVEHGVRRIVAIERPLKPLYLASLTCTGSLLFALLLAAAESLRHAGVSSTIATVLLEKQLGRTLRSYVKAGRKSYPPPRELSKQLQALAAADPELAHYIEQSSHLAAKLVKKR